MSDKTISFYELAHFTQKQTEALDATEKFKYFLYGGSMGSGKSYWLRWAGIYWLLRFAAETKIPGIRGGLFCEDYTALNDRHISKIKVEWPESLGTYNEQRHEFQLHPQFGSGVLAFRNLDDPSKYLSSEFAWVGVDELVKNSKGTFDILRTRLRWPGVQSPRFNAATNPGEGWVKQYFVEKNFPSNENESKEFGYVSALPKDNPYLPKEYFDSLSSLPEAERKAYLEGDWSAFERNQDDDGYYPLLSSTELSNAYIDDPLHAGDSVLCIDPAAGGDESTIVYASEVCQQILYKQKTKDPLAIIPIVIGHLQSYSTIRMVLIDKTGVGEGVFARLKEVISADPVLKHIVVRGVSFAESPDDKKMFDNKKAEMYWLERQWILGGGKLVRTEGWNEFMSVKFKITSDQKIHIEGKDSLRRRGFKSPNCVDAAVLRWAAPRKIRERITGGNFRDVTQRIWQGR